MIDMSLVIGSTVARQLPSTFRLIAAPIVGPLNLVTYMMYVLLYVYE